MSDIKDGGPAFPSQDVRDVMDDRAPGGWRTELQSEGGMTLRDYFAAKALETAYHFFADGYCGHIDDGQVEVDEHSSGTVAAVAYEIADSMLRAREAK